MSYIGKGKAEGARLLTGGRCLRAGLLHPASRLCGPDPRHDHRARGNLWPGPGHPAGQGHGRGVAHCAGFRIRPARLGLYPRHRPRDSTWRGGCPAARSRSTAFLKANVKTPFGGYSQSGSLSRDNGTEAMDQYLQTKTIWICTAQPGRPDRKSPSVFRCRGTTGASQARGRTDATSGSATGPHPATRRSCSGIRNPEADRMANARTSLAATGIGGLRGICRARLVAPGGAAQVTRTLPGFFADPVAETALAGILALWRGIDRLVNCGGGRMGRRSDPGGAAVLTGALGWSSSGFGAINGRLATVAGVRSVCSSCHRRFGSDWTEADDLDAALGKTPTLIVAAPCPHTPRRRTLFDATRIAG